MRKIRYRATFAMWIWLLAGMAVAVLTAPLGLSVAAGVVGVVTVVAWILGFVVVEEKGFPIWTGLLGPLMVLALPNIRDRLAEVAAHLEQRTEPEPADEP